MPRWTASTNMPVSVSTRRSFRDRPVGVRTVLDDGLRARLLGLLQRHLHDGVQRLAVLDVPRHVSGGVADVLARARQTKEAAELVGVAGLGRRAQDPGLQLVVEDVAPRLQRADLGRERLGC